MDAQRDQLRMKNLNSDENAPRENLNTLQSLLLLHKFEVTRPGDLPVPNCSKAHLLRPFHRARAHGASPSSSN